MQLLAHYLALCLAAPWTPPRPPVWGQTECVRAQMDRLWCAPHLPFAPPAALSAVYQPVNKKR